MVSAIILAYNRCAEVLITINKLKNIRLALPFELEIIVVDNASTDRTSEQVAASHPDITLITTGRNSGISGWNEGFKIAKHKYFLVLDDDSHIEDGLLDGVQYLEAHPEVGIIGFNIVDKDLKGDPLLDPEEAWKHLQKTAGFIGCGALIRKEVYDKIGGFAEWLFIYTHEFDYSIRALNAGYQTVFFEKGTVVHRVSKLNRTNKRLRVFGTRNEMGIVYKYFKNQRSKYIFRILLNNLKFLKREGLSSAWYVLKGGWEFLKLRGKLSHTPVSQDVQNFYAQNFWATQPVFKGAKKK